MGPYGFVNFGNPPEQWLVDSHGNRLARVRWDDRQRGWVYKDTNRLVPIEEQGIEIESLRLLYVQGRITIEQYEKGLWNELRKEL